MDLDACGIFERLHRAIELNFVSDAERAEHGHRGALVLAVIGVSQFGTNFAQSMVRRTGCGTGSPCRGRSCPAIAASVGVVAAAAAVVLVGAAAAGAVVFVAAAAAGAVVFVAAAGAVVGVRRLPRRKPTTSTRQPSARIY